jgi:type II secretory pathway predicted ATPase ExeA
VKANRRLNALFGLKWNPFQADIPSEALLRTPQADLFLSRVESLLDTGGFALITGDSGTGKSVTLRLLAEHLSTLRDTAVGVLTRPQSGVTDFYRELGHLFGVPLSPHNRWAGSRVLRERWRQHTESTLCRPVLVIDEAQEMYPATLNELRFLCSADLDARRLLTVVLAGDRRLTESFRSPELLSLGSRIRVRLTLEAAAAEELATSLRHALQAAGNPELMTAGLIDTLTAHAAGNRRLLMNLGAELLAAAVRDKLPRLDEQLFLHVCGAPAPRSTSKRR